jgi:hypothetical protein
MHITEIILLYLSSITAWIPQAVFLNTEMPQDLNYKNN